MAPRIKLSILSHDETVDRHAKLGWQCPECYGVQIESSKDRFGIKPDQFQCQECGCTWHRGEP